MAHINTVRRSIKVEEWIALRFGWLKRAVYREKIEITDLWIREGRQVGEMEYVYDSEEYIPLKKGDLCFAPDGTVFIKGTAQIPERLNGKKLWLSIHTAAEMIVKVNGKYVGGLDPNRDRLLLSPYIKGNKLDIEIEAYNRSKPDDERNPNAMPLRGCRQVFQGAYLSVVNEEIQNLVYDLTLFMDIIKSNCFSEDYRMLLQEELDKALNLINYETFEGVADAIKHIEEHIYSNKVYQGSGEVALVGHSHLDIAYYWRRIHTIEKNARTVLIQMRLMDRYPEFKYTHTQSYTFETLEKYYPELFEELKEKVASGQFEPVGAMYIEPDCNIPNAESLIRQCLYGQKYWREKFGITVDNVWLPDVFGNSWIMPQILSKSGVKYFVSNKMSTWNDTNKFPHNSFIWKGIDGSKVYASVPPTHFITWNMPSQIQENWDSYQDKREGGQTLSMYGYGDGGSGATEEMLELQRRFEKVSVMPKTEMMGGSEFLHRNFDGNEKLEEWDGELYLEMHRGCLTTKSDLKRYNRKLEIMLREAELRSVFRMLEGETYPQEQLTENYKLVLLNQFHDILPGSHVHPVYVDAMNDYKKVEESLMDYIGEGEKYFNSLNFDRKHITFVPDTTAGDVIRNGIKGFYCSVEVPALSSISIDKFKLEQNLSDEDNELKHCFKYESLDEGIKLETPYYSTIINSDGSIRSLYDKELDREWVSGSFNKLSLYEDRPGVYDAWDILPSYTDCPCQTYVKESLKFINQTAECIEFSAILGTAASTWKLILRFFKNSRAIEVENDVDWHEKHKLAKMLFDCNVLSREIWCDTSAGFIKRETHKNTTWQQARFEVCHHKWCDISETGGGIALINEGKYGVGVDNQRISLSLLRSTVRPDVEADMGEHKFCYMIVPHAQDAVTAGINRMALEYNVPLAKGNFNNPFNKFDFKNLFLQAVKLSEDGTMVVVRLSEQDGCRGNLKFPQEVKILNMLEDVEKTATELMYKPFEIITIGIDLKSFVK